MGFVLPAISPTRIRLRVVQQKEESTRGFRGINTLKLPSCLLCQARWALTSEKAAVRAERGRRLEAEKTEMELANIELVARRSARLKDLYNQLNDR